MTATRGPMRVAITVTVGDGPRRGAGSWADLVDFVVEAERLGVGAVWSAEAWGSDAFTPLAYLAARTSRVQLGTGIAQISSRTPAITAGTAITMAQMTEGRFVLGLGVSGPQVVEGLHGQPFAHPVARMRETIEVLRMAFAGEKLAYNGSHVVLPRPGGEGKALRLSIRSEYPIPIHLATLSPRMLELTGELANGWVGTSFTASGANAYLDHLRIGASRAGRGLDDLDLSQGGDVAFGDDVDRMIAARKPGLAFSLGGMGSATTNFYNNAYSRQGWAEVADEVRRLWVAGRREDAAAAVPDEMVLATTMIGTEAMVRDKVRAWRDAGITTLRVYPAGATPEERLTTLGSAIDIVNELNRESA